MDKKNINKFYKKYKAKHELVKNYLFNSNVLNIEKQSLKELNKILLIYLIFKKRNINILEWLKKELNNKKISEDFFNPLINCIANGKDYRNKDFTITGFQIKLFKEESNILLADEIIIEILELFDSYNWKLIDSNKMSDDESTPLILTYIFEKFINQKEGASFYTPKDTTEYIVSKSIFLWLTKFEFFKKNIQRYENEVVNIDGNNSLEIIYDYILSEKNIVNLKQVYLEIFNLKILDPTCGSGAFIFSISTILLNLLNKLQLQISKFDKDFESKSHFYLIKILLENILYGVDISEESIEIIHLQAILKLLLVRNEEEFISDTNFNFFVGNTLIGSTFTKSSVEDNKLRFDWNKLNSIKEGFDIIIGNPPYLEYSSIKKNKSYLIKNYKSEKSGNIYAYVLERSIDLLKQNGILGMIVPISMVSTPRTQTIRNIFEDNCEYSFYANFSDRPGCLFNGVHQKLTIIFSKKNNLSQTNLKYISNYIHWYDSERDKLFNKVKFRAIKEIYKGYYPKIGNEMSSKVLKKIDKKIFTINDQLLKQKSEYSISLSMRLTFWVKCFLNEKEGKEYKKLYFESEEKAKIIYCILNSSLFFLYWEIISDGWHITNKELDGFKINLEIMDENTKKSLITLADDLEFSLEKNKKFIGSKQAEYEYKHKFSKDILDKIDEVLAKYYNLTLSELNYIKNYHLNYRMSINYNETELEETH